MAERAGAGAAPLTFADAAALDPSEHPAELEAGRLVSVTRSTWRHGEIVVNVATVLRQYAKRHGGWSVAVGDPGTKLHHEPDTLRGPDAAIVRSERVPQGRGASGWLEGAPDVAVEVLGDTQTTAMLMRKAIEYLAAGARMVWLLEPDERHVLLLTPPDHVRVLGPDELLEGADALPGFAVKVADLFE